MWQTVSASAATHLNPAAKPIRLKPVVVSAVGGVEVTLPALRSDPKSVADFSDAAVGRKNSFVGKIRGLAKDLPEIAAAKKDTRDGKKREAAGSAVNALIRRELLAEVERLDSAEVCALNTIAEAIGDTLSELTVNNLLRGLLAHSDNGFLAAEMLKELGVVPPAPPPTAQQEARFAPGSEVQSPFRAVQRLGF